MKTTSIRNCQSCGKGFADGDIVYYVPIDNNITCPHCASFHGMTEQRLVEIEITCNPVTTRYDALVDILMYVEITPTLKEEEFLRWVSRCDDDTVNALCGLFKKCLRVGGKGE